MVLEGAHAARFSGGHIGVAQGYKPTSCRIQKGKWCTHSIAAGLDYVESDRSWVICMMKEKCALALPRPGGDWRCSIPDPHRGADPAWRALMVSGIVANQVKWIKGISFYSILWSGWQRHFQYCWGIGWPKWREFIHQKSNEYRKASNWGKMSASYRIFEKSTKEKKILLMTHTVVGYPSSRTIGGCLKTCAANVDIVSANAFQWADHRWPSIRKANQKALKTALIGMPFCFMRRAHEKFDFYCWLVITTLSRWVIVVLLQDLPSMVPVVLTTGPTLWGNGDLHQLSKEHRLNPIMLCTPTHKETRLQRSVPTGDSSLL